jgi:predicted RNA-binding protein with PIN domain
MSLLLLIDGYNIAQPIAPGRNPDPRWLEQNRNVLLRDLATHLSEPIRRKTCVVFDAANPPPDRPQQYMHHEIDVRFAVGYLSADELIEEMIRAHHTPRRLMVVSSDHRVQMAARRRGARHVDSEPWIDDLTDGKTRLAIPPPTDSGGAGQGSGNCGKGKENPLGTPKPRVQDPQEVADWMQRFGFPPE